MIASIQDTPLWLPQDVINYIHEFVDYKDSHKNQFKNVLIELQNINNLNTVCDNNMLYETEILLIYLSVIITIVIPLYYIRCSTDIPTDGIFYIICYLYIFTMKCIFDCMIEHIFAVNELNYWIHCLISM